MDMLFFVEKAPQNRCTYRTCQIFNRKFIIVKFAFTFQFSRSKITYCNSTGGAFSSVLIRSMSCI